MNTSSNGYYCYKILNKTYYVHRLIATYFIENLENKLEVNHINGDKQDNTVSNLEWCTRKENIQNITERKAWKKGKYVYGFNHKGAIVAILEGASQLKKINLDSTGIYLCLKNKTQTAFGLYWQYKNDFEKNKYDKQAIVKKFTTQASQIPIKVEFKNGDTKLFNSLSECSKQLKISRKKISNMFYKKKYTEDITSINTTDTLAQKQYIINKQKSFLDLIKSFNEINSSKFIFLIE
jgi:hypothetical protein